MTLRRVGVALAAMSALIFLGSSTAWAVMTSDPTECHASAQITDTAGAVVSSPDQSVVEFAVPREGKAAWTATVGTLATSHKGRIAIDLRPLFKITVYSWKGGPQRDLAAHGVTDIPTWMKYAPPGRYRIAGTRTGDGQMCAGYATIVVEGAPLSTPGGIGSVALSAVAFLGLIRAMVPKR